MKTFFFLVQRPIPLSSTPRPFFMLLPYTPANTLLPIFTTNLIHHQYPLYLCNITYKIFFFVPSFFSLLLEKKINIPSFIKLKHTQPLCINKNKIKYVSESFLSEICTLNEFTLTLFIYIFLLT